MTRQFKFLTLDYLRSHCIKKQLFHKNSIFYQTKIWPTYIYKKPTTDSNSLIFTAFGKTFYDIVLSLIYRSVSPQNSIQNCEKVVKKSWAIIFGCPWIWLVNLMSVSIWWIGFKMSSPDWPILGSLQPDWSIFRILQSDWAVIKCLHLIGQFLGSFNPIGRL
jgi:hypothetical protein